VAHTCKQPGHQETRAGRERAERAQAKSARLTREEERQRMQEQPASSLPSSGERSSSSVHHMEMDLREGKLPLICFSFCCRRLIWFTAAVLGPFVPFTSPELSSAVCRDGE
jgi:hypothetical protein